MMRLRMPRGEPDNVQQHYPLCIGGQRWQQQAVQSDHQNQWRPDAATAHTGADNGSENPDSDLDQPGRPRNNNCVGACDTAVFTYSGR